MHTCYVDCTLAPSHDLHAIVSVVMWCVHRRLLYHTPQAEANKRISAEAKSEAKRPAGRPRRELPDDVTGAIEAMTAAADEPGDTDVGLLFSSQPGTPIARAPQPSTPRGSMPPPLMRASTQVVARSVLHPCPWCSRSHIRSCDVSPSIAWCLLSDTLMSLMHSVAPSVV